MTSKELKVYSRNQAAGQASHPNMINTPRLDAAYADCLDDAGEITRLEPLYNLARRLEFEVKQAACDVAPLCPRCGTMLTSETVNDYQGEEHHSKYWLSNQAIASFRKRADKWECEQGELGKIVASELRVLVDCFEEILTSK